MITIKLASFADIENIALMKTETYAVGCDDEFLFALTKNFFVDEFRKRLLIQFLKGETILLLIENSTIIGFLIYSHASSRNTTSMEIKNIYVTPYKRRKNLGKLLLETALNEIKKERFQEVLVWIVEDSMSTVQFYEKLGFHPVEKTRIDSYKEIFLKEICYKINLE